MALVPMVSLAETPPTGKPDAGKPPVRFGGRGGAKAPSLVRLRAHLNSRVKVPDLTDTVGSVTESNCIGAIPPGGEQLEVNEQSVTKSPPGDTVNSIRSAVLASLLGKRRSPNKIVRPALREWNASGRGPQMVGDGMFGRSGDVNQGTTAGGEQRAGRGQSVRSSAEASNDRGAKGRRDVVVAAGRLPSRKGRGSAERLFAAVRGNLAGESGVGCQWAARKRVSGAQVCAAGAGLPYALRPSA
jgi:hypothetical protein